MSTANLALPLHPPPCSYSASLCRRSIGLSSRTGILCQATKPLRLLVPLPELGTSEISLFDGSTGAVEGRALELAHTSGAPTRVIS